MNFVPEESESENENESETYTLSFFPPLFFPKKRRMKQKFKNKLMIMIFDRFFPLIIKNSLKIVIVIIHN